MLASQFGYYLCYCDIFMWMSFQNTGCAYFKLNSETLWENSHLLVF